MQMCIFLVFPQNFKLFVRLADEFGLAAHLQPLLMLEPSGHQICKANPLLKTTV